MGAGDHDGPLVGRGQHAGDVEHVVGFEAEVELFHDGLGEQLDQRRRVGQRGYRDAADQVGRDPAHGGQMSLRTRPATVGRCTFTTTSSPVRSGGGVDLGDRRRGQGRGLEAARTPRSRGRPRSASTTSRTASKVSGGTWSRRSRNSPTSSGGKTPSPDGQDLARA